MSRPCRLSVPVQLRPPLGDRQAEVDNQDLSEQGIELGPPTRRARGAAGETNTRQKLGAHDGGQRGRLVAERGQGRLPRCGCALDGHERAGVDHEAHGLSGGRSACPTRSRSAAKPGSAPSDATPRGEASRRVVVALPATGASRATGSPFRSMRNESLGTAPGRGCRPAGGPARSPRSVLPCSAFYGVPYDL